MKNVGARRRPARIRLDMGRSEKTSSRARKRESALRTLLLRALAHSQPTDLCVLIFSLTVIGLFFTLDQPFMWEAFYYYIKDPLIWMAFGQAPLLLILITEDRVGDTYNVKRTLHRYLRGVLTFGRDFTPFLICLVIYLNLADKVHAVNPVDRDDWLITIDQKLFGFQASQWMERFSNVYLDEWMYLSYVVFGWYPIVLGLLFLARGQRRAFRDLLLAYVMASFIGYLGYIAVPAIGPRYTLEYSVDLRHGFFASVEWAMKNNLYIPRDCFPSLHTANTLVVLGMAARYRPKTALAFAPFCLSTVVATVYLRYHYVIDVWAGAALAGAVLYLAPLWNERWDRWTAGLREDHAASKAPMRPPGG